jgi:hypothetical protein
MGEAELDVTSKQLVIHANVLLYGQAISEEFRARIGEEIETLWNEPWGMVTIRKESFHLVFRIKSYLFPHLQPADIYQNTNPRNNYFRIEEYAHGNISFVDGIGSNTGYFKAENLYPGSTTAAHEFGHTIGLDHPEDLDLRGRGRPGLMYPRGTLVDPAFQYDPAIPAGQTGGTMHPMHRRVWPEEIALLRLNKLVFNAERKAIVGAYSSVYHEAHLP